MTWILIVLGVYGLILAAVAWFSVRPFRTPVFLSPGALGAPQEEVSIATAEGHTLRGWWIEPPNARVVAVMAHGYMMNRCELVPLAVHLARLGVASVAIDLRAHGKSGGATCGFGVRETADVRAAAEWARTRVPGVPVVLIGSSMGAAASALPAAQCPGLAQGLVLDSAYSTLLSGMLGWWRFLGGKVLSVVLAPTVILALPVLRCNPARVDVADSLRVVGVPVLLIHGDADDLALPSEAERNHAACPGSALVWLPGCGHSEGRWIHPERYHAAVEELIERVLASAATSETARRSPAQRGTS